MEQQRQMLQQVRDECGQGLPRVMGQQRLMLQQVRDGGGE